MKATLLALCLASTAVPITAGTFDATIGTNYPGAGAAIIGMAKNASYLYVASSSEIYRYNPATRAWQTILGTGVNNDQQIKAICLSPIDSYLYAAGHLLLGDDYFTLARYNPANGQWTHIGANPESYQHITCIAVARDGYLYMGQWGAGTTLPSGATCNGVARFYLLSGNVDDSQQWDNMLTGVDDYSPSDQVGVYSLCPTQMRYTTNGAYYYYNRIVVGGQFWKTTDDGATNHSVALWQDVKWNSTGGTNELSHGWLSLANPATGLYGVVNWALGTYPSDYGCFVEQAVPATGTGLNCNQVLLGGNFEGVNIPPDPNFLGGGFNGLASVNTDTRVISGWGWPFTSSDYPPTDAAVSTITALAVNGTNTFVAGTHNAIGTNVSYVAPAGTGNENWSRLDPTQKCWEWGSVFNGTVAAMTSDSSELAPVYIGGDFSLFGSTSVNQIIQYNPPE